jgi:hypothetical protein
MKWKVACAVTATLVFFGMAAADTFTAIITEVKDGKVTFYKAKFNKEEKKLEKEEKSDTLPVADDVKVVKGKFDKDAGKFTAGDAIESGLKSDTFTKISEKGVFVTITTDADNKKITEIMTFGFGKKKKDDK